MKQSGMSTFTSDLLINHKERVYNSKYVVITIRTGCILNFHHIDKRQHL